MTREEYIPLVSKLTTILLASDPNLSWDEINAARSIALKCATAIVLEAAEDYDAEGGDI